MNRKTRLVLIIFTLWSLLWPQIVLADGMIIPELAETGYVTVRYHHVTVDIVDNHAVTHVEQAFHNPHDVPVTAHYIFPVPPDAMVTDFEATVDGDRQTVNRQDAAATNTLIYDLVARRHDPSLLQYADWETLTFTIDLDPGATRVMELAYEEVLAPSGGMFHYRYVLSTERYSADLLEEASITVNVSASHGLGTLYSPSHTLVTEDLGEGRVRATWQAEYVRPTEDFHLHLVPTEGADEGFGSGLLTGRQPALDDASRDHFLFLFAPEFGRASEDAMPKDIVFVIDRSGSMSGEKIVQAQDALQFILGQLDVDDRFAIVGFDDRLDVFGRTLQPADAGTLRQARRFVRDLYARESTDLDAAVQRGLEILRESAPRDGVSRMLVFLTDGLPTAGVTDVPTIVERAQQANAPVEARLHAFGVGYDVNTHLLDRLAGENGGSVTYVQPGENLELVLTDFYRRIAHPVLTDLRIEFEGIEVDALHPATLPDMFEGSSLLLSGRYRAATEDGEVTVHVRGRSGEQVRSFSYTFDLAETGDHAFVPRLWATRQIGRLLDTVRVEGETDALVEKVQGLGLTYGLVTPYTTFVIAAQTNGAASGDNMALYGRGAELNRASGETTVQARVQNQSYQQAAQANLATGANVVNSGHRNLAQVSTQQIDLMLLQGKRDLVAPLDDAWIADNIEVDRQIDFGSEAYFELADDPQARVFLQAGNNVTFAYQGAVIQVEDPDAPATSFDLQGSVSPSQLPSDNVRPFDSRAPQSTRQPGAAAPVQLFRALVNAVYGYVRALMRAVPR